LPHFWSSPTCARPRGYGPRALFLAWLALLVGVSETAGFLLAAIFVVTALALNPGGLRRRLMMRPAAIAARRRHCIITMQDNGSEAAA